MSSGGLLKLIEEGEIRSWKSMSPYPGTPLNPRLLLKGWENEFKRVRPSLNWKKRLLKIFQDFSSTFIKLYMKTYCFPLKGGFLQTTTAVLLKTLGLEPALRTWIVEGSILKIVLQFLASEEISCVCRIIDPDEMREKGKVVLKFLPLSSSGVLHLLREKRCPLRSSRIWGLFSKEKILFYEK